MKKFCILIILFWSISCQLSDVDQNKISIYSTVKKVDIKRNEFVIDEIGLLNKDQIAELSSILKKYYDISDIEILCIITSSFEKFGSEQNYTDYFLYDYDKDAMKNIVLITFFSKEKSIFIRTNKNSTKIYSQEMCQKVIELDMLPSFKKGDFFEGFREGIKS